MILRQAGCVSSEPRVIVRHEDETPQEALPSDRRTCERAEDTHPATQQFHPRPN